VLTSEATPNSDPRLMGQPSPTQMSKRTRPRSQRNCKGECEFPPLHRGIIPHHHGAQSDRFGTKRTTETDRYLSASLIGRLGSSAFRLSTNSSVDVAHGLALLFGLGTKALPSWDSKTRWNNLSGDLAVDVTAGSSGQTNSPHPSSREGHHSTAGWSSILLLSAVKPLRLPCSTGTRCRQPTCGA